MRAPAADLEIHVTTWKADGQTRLNYVLHAAELHYTYYKIEGETIRGCPDDYQARLLGTIEQLGHRLGGDGSQIVSGEIGKELDKLGHQLYKDLFPRKLQDAYRDFREKVTTLLIVSDEPWIPWELVKPYETSQGEGFDDDFLCCRFELTRWLSGETSPEAQLGVARVTCIEAGKAPGGEPLSHAEEESGLLAGLARRSNVESLIVGDATYRDVERTLRLGGNGVIHFVGHGQFDSDDPDASRFFLVDRRSWRPRDLLDHGIESRLRQDRPLVFFASCQVGQLAWALTRLGGWASRWILDGGCGAFIAPQWSIGDASSSLFVKTFYHALERGDTIAKATRTARLEVRGVFPDSPTWLAYTVYAHPNGYLRFGLGPAGVRSQCRPSLERLSDHQFSLVAQHLDPDGKTVDTGMVEDRPESCQKLIDLATQRGEKGWIDLQESILAAQSPFPLPGAETSGSWVQRPQCSWQADGGDLVGLGMAGVPLGEVPIRQLREVALLTWEGLGFRDGRFAARIWLPQLRQGATAGLVLRYVERRGAVFAVLRGTGNGGAVLELWQREGSGLTQLDSHQLPADLLDCFEWPLWIEMTGRHVRAGLDGTGQSEAWLSTDLPPGYAGVARFGPGVVRFKDLHLAVTSRALLLEAETFSGLPAVAPSSIDIHSTEEENDRAK